MRGGDLGDCGPVMDCLGRFLRAWSRGSVQLMCASETAGWMFLFRIRFLVVQDDSHLPYGSCVLRLHRFP